MTDTPSSLRQRAAGLAASALVFASILLTPATALAAGGPGTPPNLVNDVITTAEDTPASGNVLANDVNSSGVVPFTVTTYTQPAASVGTIVIAANGDYTFTPAPNFSGSGSATYMASNTKHEVGPATITINVSNTQDPPSAGDDNVTVVEDTATNVKAAILANDSDPDGDTISVTGASNAAGGSVSLAGGAVTFTPTGDLCGNGAGSFDYDIAATGGTDSAHVTVDITCVDDAPVATNDDASGTEDQDVVIDEATLVGNDSDPENDSLSVSAVSNPSGGSVSRAGGQVTFTPTADLCGDNSASFDYTLSDGNGGTDTGTVTIDLECTADAPVAHNDTASGTEDQDVVIDAGDLAGNDTDADGDTLTVTAVSNPSGGTVALVAGTVTFTPDTNLCGDASASFKYTVDDGNGGTDTGTVTIDLGCENDNPVANDDTVSADEDTATDVTAAVLSNDTDVDGDTLVVSDADNATGGTVGFAGGVVTFTPDAGQCGDGLGSFDYVVSDGNGGTDPGHATVDVTCANDAPVASDDGVSGTEDQDLVIDGGDLTSNDNDGDGNALTVSAVTNPSGGTVVLVGTTITFTPNAELCGDDVASFDYTVDDGNGGTDTGTVTISLDCVNDNPVADDDTASGTEDQDVTVSADDLVAEDTDVEGDTLSVDSVGNPSGGTVSLAAGIATFTPAADLCGDDVASFDYTVVDGNGGSDTGTVTISLDCVNDNPVATDDTASGTEDQDITVPADDLLANDSDVDDGDTLSVDSVGNPSGGTVSLVAGTVTFIPDANLCGDAAASFDYTLVDDHGGSDTGTVWIDLACANDGPTAVDDPASGTEDQDVSIDAGDLTSNDTDIDGPSKTVTAVINPSGGTVSLLGTTITFVPAANLCGDDVASFDYTLTDGTDTDTGTVTISLTCVNDAPVAVDDVATVAGNSAAADHIVLGNDTDVDGDTLSLTDVDVDGAKGTATINGTKVTFTPAHGFSGNAVITYTVSDGDLDDTGTLTVTVNVAGGPDITAPAASLRVAFGLGRVDTTAPLRISWSATDAGSGVDHYQVQTRMGGKPWANLSVGKATSKGLVVPFKKQFQVRVRAWDKAGNRSAWVYSGFRKVMPVQNLTTTVIKYTGPWTFVPNRASSGGGYSVTLKVGASASWTATGIQFAYVAPKLATGGFVKVYLDGQLKGRFNLHQAGTAVGRVIARLSMTPGQHTIKIVSDSAGKRGTLDAFLVLK